MNMIRGVVYKYTSPSNKVYIGTTIDEKNRRRSFLCQTQDYAGPKINLARKKYGAKNFKYEILFVIESFNLDELLNILDKKEVEFIKLFDSVNNGYNLSEGGRLNHNLTLSEESKRRKLQKIQKPILQYNLDGKFIKEWPSAKIAGKILNISNGNICEVLKGNRYQCSNYIFKYKTGENIPDTIEIIPTKQQKKIVLQLDESGKILKEFPSIQEASREAGVTRTTMYNYLTGKSKGYLKTKYRWRMKYAIK